MLSLITLIASFAIIALCQQQCYFGPGAEQRGPAGLVPCKGSGTSACCLLGDTCLSGSTCYNYRTGDLYQYGCTDITYRHESCPYKCGWNTTKSPWTALQYCNNVAGVTNTWTCHSPESCSCEWNSTYDLLVLEPLGCREMGSNARVALFAPSTLAPYVSLPSTYGGSTGYYSTTTISGNVTWISTAIAGYTPDTLSELTTYQAGPSSIIVVNPSAAAAPSTTRTALRSSTTATSGFISTPTSIAPTSIVPASATSGSTAASATSPATTSPSAIQAETTSGLSTGAQAGIGAGVGVAGVLVGALLVALCLSRRRKQRDTPPRPQPSMDPQTQFYQGAYSPKKNHAWPQSQSASPFSERSAQWQPPTPYTQYAYEAPQPQAKEPGLLEMPGHVNIPELSSYSSRDPVSGTQGLRTQF